MERVRDKVDGGGGGEAQKHRDREAEAEKQALTCNSPGVLEDPGRPSLPWVQLGPAKGVNEVMEESRGHACNQGHRKVKSVSGLGMRSSTRGSMFALERKCQVRLGEEVRAQSWLGVTHCGSFGSFGASRSL